jgi:hypothetical protein
MKSGGGFGWGILALLTGIALFSDPKCKHGCQSVAEHLVVTGVRLLTGRA